jgi:hypothetical protein
MQTRGADHSAAVLIIYLVALIFHMTSRKNLINLWYPCMSNIISGDEDEDDDDGKIKKYGDDDEKINFHSQILPDCTHLDIICNVVRPIPLKE